MYQLMIGAGNVTQRVSAVTMQRLLTHKRVGSLHERVDSLHECVDSLHAHNDFNVDFDRGGQLAKLL